MAVFQLQNKDYSLNTSSSGFQQLMYLLYFTLILYLPGKSTICIYYMEVHVFNPEEYIKLYLINLSTNKQSLHNIEY